MCFVRPRNGSRSSNAKLAKIEYYGEKTHWSELEISEPEMKGLRQGVGQESKR